MLNEYLKETDDESEKGLDVSEVRTRSDEPTFLASSDPQSSEFVRRTGLAWSIGIAFFSAVVFMLVLGWGADLLFGTSPWGIVIGIVIGALIGFVQLFRISSEILRK